MQVLSIWLHHQSFAKNSPVMTAYIKISSASSLDPHAASAAVIMLHN